MKKNDSDIILEDEQGNKNKYKVFLTFYSDQFNKNYILFSYVDNKRKNRLQAKRKIQAFTYKPTSYDYVGAKLYPIKNNQEWNTVKEVAGAFIG